MKRIGCIFNYAPHYREAIFKEIDDNFDAQFYFSDIKSDILKMDYNKFKKYPITIREKRILKKLNWRKDILSLPFKNYDSFLVTGDSSLSYLPFYILCRILNKKVYAWGHGLKKCNNIVNYYTKLLYFLVDGYFAYSEGGKNRLIDLGVPSSKIYVIYNSLCDKVDSTLQSNFKSNILKEYFRNDYPTIFFVGRLTKVKQLNWLIDALLIHKKNNINYNLLIIGDGSEKQKLIDLAVENKLEKNIWFYGECHDENKLSMLIYNADLCVSPGNVGLTAIHSMQYGTPVLSHSDFETQMPEYESIIPGITGDLYEKGNFEDFCNKIECWIMSDRNRSEIRESCYEMINQKYNSKKQIEILKKVIL